MDDKERHARTMHVMLPYYQPQCQFSIIIGRGGEADVEQLLA